MEEGGEGWGGGRREEMIKKKRETKSRLIFQRESYLMMQKAINSDRSNFSYLYTSTFSTE